MAKTWPATLPAPIASSVKLHTQKNTREIEFSARNRRTVTRASNPPSIVECEIRMDAVQLDAFDYFFKFDLSYGVLWINADWLLPLGFSSHYCRFLEMPKTARRGGIYVLQCVFEVVAADAVIGTINPVWPVSNIQPDLFPPAPDNLKIWYKADEDTAHFSPATYNYGEALPNFATNPGGVIKAKQSIWVWGGSPKPMNPTEVTVETPNGMRGIKLFSHGGYYDADLYSGQNDMPNNYHLFAVVRNASMIIRIKGPSTSAGAGLVAIYSSGGLYYPENYQFSLGQRLIVEIIRRQSENQIDYFINGAYPASGRGFSATPGFYFNDRQASESAHLHELLIYDRRLSNDERGIVNNELMQKWQIS